MAEKRGRVGHGRLERRGRGRKKEERESESKEEEREKGCERGERIAELILW